MSRRQIEEWFDWMDRILDIHRANFVFREVTEEELGQHKAALRDAIRTCHFLLALIADPDFNAADLVSRLKVRIQQLQDAYDTFHNSEVSDQKAERILQDAFPE